MFSRELINAGHTRRFTVRSRQSEGWELLVEDDDVVVRQTQFRDWHRVERALNAIDRETNELQAHGWMLTSAEALGRADQSTKR
jgi:hypothetical protein